MVIASCNPFSGPIENSDKAKQWVFISIESPMKYDTANYHYYGQINREVLKNMNKGDVSGYFEIQKIRYINQSNQLEVYEDTALIGSKFFRIKDIARVELLKKDPLLFYEKDQIAENSKVISK